MDKLLVAGIDTVVGANLAIALEPHYKICGWALDESDCWQHAAASNNDNPWTERLERLAPSAVLYCPTLASSSWDLAGRQVVNETEIDDAAWLASACRAARRPLAAIITDAVFAGPRMFHSEDSPQTALGSIADSARAMTEALAAGGALVLRSHVYGWSGVESLGGDAGFAQRSFEQLVAQQACPVDAVRHATPLLASDLADIVHAALNKGLRGVYHATGAERVSPHRFAAQLASVLGLTGRQVRLETPADPPVRIRMDETSLNTQRIRKTLGISLPMLREGLERFVEQSTGAFRQRLTEMRNSRMLAADAA